ncbi:hypothetical protein HMPREF9575_00607 [Cutibacterium acnes HL110PA1]|nr:hypothetical protein HMPREF9575_00607 [Cutibacterium acnes HL110PA1]
MNSLLALYDTVLLFQPSDRPVLVRLSPRRGLVIFHFTGLTVPASCRSAVVMVYRCSQAGVATLPDSGPGPH